MPIKITVNSFMLLVIYLRSNNITKILNSLKYKISKTYYFMKNISVILNISELQDAYLLDWKKIKKKFLSIKVFIIGINGFKDNKLKQIILNSGLLVFSENHKTNIKKKIIL
ncbi:hypothetical protein [Buchnera aphidicola]|uniref:hypothetical protein n=1 Tax=Buchnera aphidicola TaxID=9 RepID=UPI003464E52F